MDEQKIFKDQKESNILKQVIYKYLPFWPLFVITTGLSMAFAIIYLRSQVQLYVANAKVLLKDPNKGSGDSKVLDALNIFSEKKIVENEILVLRSSGLLQKVTKELALYATVYNKGRVQTEELYHNNSPVWFNADQPQNVSNVKYFFSVDWRKKLVTIDNKKVPFDSSILIDNILYRLVINPAYNPVTGKNFFVQFNYIAGVAGSLAGSISAKALSRVSTVIDISMQTPAPEKGTAVLNKLFEIYNRDAIEDKNQIAAKTLAFIDDRLRLVIYQLDSVERNIASYKSRESVVDMGTQAGLYFGNVKDLDKQVSGINLQLDLLNDINNYTRSKGKRPGTVPSLLLVNDPTLATLLDKLYTAEFASEKALSVGGERSDAVLLATETVIRIKKDLLENMANIKATLLAEKRDYTARIYENNNLLSRIPQKERGFLEISRQQAIKNNIYTFLLQKREETAVSSASTIADLRVIEPASAYGPVSPIAKNFYLTGLAAGILSAAFFVYVKEIFNNKVLFRKDIEDKTEVPVVGEFIQVAGNETIVIQDGKRTVIAEQIRTLRTNLSFLGLNEKENTILITSSISGEGKSFIAINLAISFTLTGKKVGLLEMDLRKPKLGKLLNIKRNEGISTYLVNKATIESIIKETAIKDLCLIPSGPIPPNPTELMTTPRFKEMMDELKKRFDYLIIDTAPVAPVTDAQILQEHADINMFVVRHGHTPKVFLQMVNGLHQQKKFKNMCIIFNGLKRRGFSIYGYGYGGYGNGYGYGYGYGYGGGSYGGGYYVEEKKGLLSGLKNIFKN